MERIRNKTHSQYCLAHERTAIGWWLSVELIGGKHTTHSRAAGRRSRTLEAATSTFMQPTHSQTLSDTDTQNTVVKPQRATASHKCLDGGCHFIACSTYV